MDPATEQPTPTRIQRGPHDQKAAVGTDHAAFELGPADERAAATLPFNVTIGDEIGDRLPDGAATYAIVAAERVFRGDFMPWRPFSRAEME